MRISKMLACLFLYSFVFTHKFSKMEVKNRWSRVCFMVIYGGRREPHPANSGGEIDAPQLRYSCIIGG